jgi:hypothetical protein
MVRFLEYGDVDIHSESLRLSDGSKVEYDLLGDRITQSTKSAQNWLWRVVGIPRDGGINWEKEIKHQRNIRSNMEQTFAVGLVAAISCLLLPVAEVIPLTLGAGLAAVSIIGMGAAAYRGKKANHSVALLKQHRERNRPHDVDNNSHHQERVRPVMRARAYSNGGFRVMETPSISSYMTPEQFNATFREPYEQRVASCSGAMETFRSFDRTINTINAIADHEIQEREIESNEQARKRAMEELAAKRVHTRWEDLDVVTENDIK